MSTLAILLFTYFRFYRKTVSDEEQRSNGRNKRHPWQSKADKQTYGG
jgi:hypothetical protein